MKRNLKKVLAFGLVVFVVFGMSSVFAFANETNMTEDGQEIYTYGIDEGAEGTGAELIRNTLNSLLDSGDPDACVTVIEGLTSEAEVNAFVGTLSDDIMCHIEINCVITSESERNYSVTVYAAELWNPDLVDSGKLQLRALGGVSFNDYMREGWLNLESEINVISYLISLNNYDVADVYYCTVLDNPDCFNAVTAFSYRYTSAGYIYSFLPEYIETDAAEYSKMKTAFDASVTEALNAVESANAATDLGKAYVLHNWLCANADYNYTEAQKSASEETDWTNFTAYGTLVNKTGVCQSYALAYSTLLNECGVGSAALVVNQMDHAWNEVEIDDNWYHVDVTWDDTGSTTTPARFNYFMKSDEAFGSTTYGSKHYGWANGPYATYPSYGWDESLTCSSTLYDSTNWKNFDPSESCITGHTYEKTEGIVKCSVCGELFTGIWTDGNEYKDGQIVLSINKKGYIVSNGQVQNGAGVVKIGDDYYYGNSAGKASNFGGTAEIYYTIKESKANGLLNEGLYRICTDGKITTEFLYKNYYYKDGVITKSAGVVKDGDNYYYINGTGAAFNSNGTANYYYTVKSTKTNGLIDAGFYKIGTDGKIAIAFIYNNNYYYENGSLGTGKGIIRLDGSLYYVNNKGVIYKNGTATIKETKTNGLCEAGSHTFDENGVMIK